MCSFLYLPHSLLIPQSFNLKLMKINALNQYNISLSINTQKQKVVFIRKAVACTQNIHTKHTHTQTQLHILQILHRIHINKTLKCNMQCSIYLFFSNMYLYTAKTPSFHVHPNTHTYTYIYTIRTCIHIKHVNLSYA